MEMFTDLTWFSQGESHTEHAVGLPWCLASSRCSINVVSLSYIFTLPKSVPPCRMFFGFVAGHKCVREHAYNKECRSVGTGLFSRALSREAQDPGEEREGACITGPLFALPGIQKIQ